MSKKEEKGRRKESKKEEPQSHSCDCPVRMFFDKFACQGKGNQEFWEHLDKARIELLEAFRSMIDHRIKTIKEKGAGRSQGLEKIEIEEGG